MIQVPPPLPVTPDKSLSEIQATSPTGSPAASSEMTLADMLPVEGVTDTSSSPPCAKRVRIPPVRRLFSTQSLTFPVVDAAKPFVYHSHVPLVPSDRDKDGFFHVVNGTLLVLFGPGCVTGMNLAFIPDDLLRKDAPLARMLVEAHGTCAPHRLLQRVVELEKTRSIVTHRSEPRLSAEYGDRAPLPVRVVLTNVP